MADKFADAGKNSASQRNAKKDRPWLIRTYSGHSSA